MSHGKHKRVKGVLAASRVIWPQYFVCESRCFVCSVMEMPNKDAKILLTLVNKFKWFCDKRAFSIARRSFLFYHSAISKHVVRAHIVVEMGSHPTKRFLFNHTTPFLTKGLEKSLCHFTGTVFVQCENPVFIPTACSCNNVLALPTTVHAMVRFSNEHLTLSWSHDDSWKWINELLIDTHLKGFVSQSQRGSFGIDSAAFQQAHDHIILSETCRPCFLCCWNGLSPDEMKTRL